jgi:hypothetical protein
MRRRIRRWLERRRVRRLLKHLAPRELRDMNDPEYLHREYERQYYGS